MFTRLGHFIVRRRTTVLVATLLGLVLAIVIGGGVFGRLLSGGFDDPGSESVRAADELEAEFDTGGAELVVIVTADDGGVDTPAVAAAGMALTDELAARDGVDDVASYWSLGSPEQLRSADGDRALILMRFPGGEDDADRSTVVTGVIEDLHDREIDGVTLQLAGEEAVFAQVGETIEGDLARAEMIAIPLTLLLLLFVFGGVVAAGLPLLVGVVSVFGAFLVLFGVSQFTVRVDLLDQPHHGARPRSRDRLLAVHRQPVPRGARTRPQRGRCGRADGRDGRTDGRVQCHDGRRVTQRTAHLPAVLPAIVRRTAASA